MLVRSAAGFKRVIRCVVGLSEGIVGLVLITVASRAAAAPHPTPPGPSTLPKGSPLTTPTAPSPALAPLVSPAPAGRGRLEPFGRWQPKISRCERRLAAAVADADPCFAVQVDQRSSGVFRVSWLDAGSSQGLAHVLTFVGTLAAGRDPLICRQATCRLAEPFALTLSSVSQSAFDRRGVAGGLPSAWPATGQCHLERERIRCEAKALTGEIWTASAQMP